MHSARATHRVLAAIAAADPSSVTLDLREPNARLQLPREGRTLVLLLPTQLSASLEQALDELDTARAVVAVTPAHRITPVLERAFPYRIDEAHLLEGSPA